MPVVPVRFSEFIAVEARRNYGSGKEGRSMGTVVLELPKGICDPAELGSLGAFFEPSATSDEVLGHKEVRLINGLLSALDTYLLAVISSRSLKEFIHERTRTWPKYIRGLRALQDTFNNIVPESIMEELSAQAICSVEKDIQKTGESVFGATLTSQALFTLWTVGEIRSLGTRNRQPQVA